MNIAIALVRLIHIFSGVFWAGGAFVLAGFVEPAVIASAPDGNKFMQAFMNKFPVAMGIAGPLAVLAGFLLYWNDSGGLQVGWITTATGLSFTVGRLAGLVGLYIGLFITRVAATDVAKLGKEIQSGGKPPTQDQLSKMKALQETLTQASVWTAIVLAITVAAMAMARYL